MNRNLLIVDDEPNVISSLRRELKREDCTLFSALSGEEGLRVLEKQDIAVVLSDLSMPEMNGIALLERARDLKPDTVRVLLTGCSSESSARAAINRAQVFEYLTKPWSREALVSTLNRSFSHHHLITENRRLQRLTKAQNRELKKNNVDLEARVRRRTRQLQEAVHEGVMMLAKAAEAKDDDTGEHVLRIRELTEKICCSLGLDARQTGRIGLSSILHDVGKIHIPDRILQKPGKLTPAEFEIMKTHTLAGERILGQTDFYQTAREIARSHHERWDGSGYPDGLSGASVPLAARIVSVADVYDALTSERPYKTAWPHRRALEEMARLKGKFFDPEILEAFFDQVIADQDDFEERKASHGNRR